MSTGVQIGVLEGADAPVESATDRRLSIVTRIALALALAVGGWLAFVAPLNHDVAWGLYSARRVLAGARPYVDFVETNPPLFIYLSLPLEWIALRTGWAESSVLALAIGALTVAALVGCLRVLRMMHDSASALAGGLLLAIAYTALVLPGRDFAQREHVTLLLLLPYCVLCARRAAATTVHQGASALSLTAGILAGIGFALKPHFLLAWMAVSACVIVMRRRVLAVVAPESIAVTAVIAVYTAAVFLLTPEYVFDVIPRVYTQYESAYAVDLRGVLADPLLSWLTVSGLLLIAGAGALAADRFAAALIRCTSLASVAFLVVYVIQMKGYYYHRFPAVAFHVISAAIAAAAFVNRFATRPPGSVRAPHGALAWRSGLLALAVIPALLIGWDSMMVQRALADARRAAVSFGVIKQPFVDLVRQKAGGRPIYVLSSSVAPAFPLVNLSGTTWPYRYNCLWPLPVHYRDDVNGGRAPYRRPEAMSAAERAFFDDVVAQLQRTPPAILIVDQTRFKQGFGAVHFDYIDYFQQSPAFAALFREYTPLLTGGPYAVYEHRAISPVRY